MKGAVARGLECTCRHLMIGFVKEDILKCCIWVTSIGACRLHPHSLPWEMSRVRVTVDTIEQYNQRLNAITNE